MLRWTWLGVALGALGAGALLAPAHAEMRPSEISAVAGRILQLSRVQKRPIRPGLGNRPSVAPV